MIIDETFQAYRTRPAPANTEPSWNGQLMVHFAALTAAFYRTLLQHGLTVDEAERLTAEATWNLYRRMAAVPGWISARLARGARDRVQRATDLFRRFPFSRPAYEMVDLPGDDKTVAFDVVRCPVAKYFRVQGLEDLCVRSFCNLDFPLAEDWGARLERRGTLVAGAPRCDFRWRIPTRARSD